MASSPAGFKGPFICHADIQIQEGKGDIFEAEFRKVRECANSDKEPGCIEFRTSRNGDRFLAFEQYENLEALKTHGETDVFKAFVGVVKNLHSRPPVVLFYEEIDNAPQPKYKSKM
ncbi:hypothetical protein FRC10_003574 [Ceratobasidium sp. 414]|nr:hypothetical protein FRC10_003574 [Ceratobasidium sp. 414]